MGRRRLSLWIVLLALSLSALTLAAPVSVEDVMGELDTDEHEGEISVRLTTPATAISVSQLVPRNPDGTYGERCAPNDNALCLLFPEGCSPGVNCTDRVRILEMPGVGESRPASSSRNRGDVVVEIRLRDVPSHHTIVAIPLEDETKISHLVGCDVRDSKAVVMRTLAGGVTDVIQQPWLHLINVSSEMPLESGIPPLMLCIIRADSGRLMVPPRGSHDITVFYGPLQDHDETVPVVVPSERVEEFAISSTTELSTSTESVSTTATPEISSPELIEEPEGIRISAPVKIHHSDAVDFRRSPSASTGEKEKPTTTMEEAEDAPVETEHRQMVAFVSADDLTPREGIHPDDAEKIKIPVVDVDELRPRELLHQEDRRKMEMDRESVLVDHLKPREEIHEEDIKKFAVEKREDEEEMTTTEKTKQRDEREKEEEKQQNRALHKDVEKEEKEASVEHGHHHTHITTTTQRPTSHRHTTVHHPSQSRHSTSTTTEDALEELRRDAEGGRPEEEETHGRQHLVRNGEKEFKDEKISNESGSRNHHISHKKHLEEVEENEEKEKEDEVDDEEKRPHANGHHGRDRLSRVRVDDLSRGDGEAVMNKKKVHMSEEKKEDSEGGEEEGESTTQHNEGQPLKATESEDWRSDDGDDDDSSSHFSLFPVVVAATLSFIFLF